jgi:hypothetical protein
VEQVLMQTMLQVAVVEPARLVVMLAEPAVMVVPD